MHLLPHTSTRSPPSSGLSSASELVAHHAVDLLRLRRRRRAEVVERGGVVGLEALADGGQEHHVVAQLGATALEHLLGGVGATAVVDRVRLLERACAERLLDDASGAGI